MGLVAGRSCKGRGNSNSRRFGGVATKPRPRGAVVLLSGAPEPDGFF